MEIAWPEGVDVDSEAAVVTVSTRFECHCP